jgi:hypothetical protein
VINGDSVGKEEMDGADDTISDNIEVVPVVVISQTFPARPSSIPDIRDFVRRCLAGSPLSEDDNREVGETVSRALLEAAGPTGAISVSFRIFPDHVEVDVLRSGATLSAGGTGAGGAGVGGAGLAAGMDPLTALLRAGDEVPAQSGAGSGAGGAPGGNGSGSDGSGVDSPESFAEWMAGVLRREGLTMEAAARQLGVSVKTVSRWVGGTTEPRLRDLRRIRELFGEIPFA